MQKKTHTVTPEMHKAMIQDIKAGLRYEEIASQYGVRTGTVGYHYLLGKRDGEITEEEFARRYLNRAALQQPIKGKLPQDKHERFLALLHGYVKPARQVIAIAGLSSEPEEIAGNERYRSSMDVARQLKDTVGVTLRPGDVYYDLEILRRAGLLDVIPLPRHTLYAHSEESALLLPIAFRMMSHQVETGTPAERFLGRNFGPNLLNRATVLTYLRAHLDLFELGPEFPLEKVFRGLEEREVLADGKLSSDAAHFVEDVLLPVSWVVEQPDRIRKLQEKFYQARDTGVALEYCERVLQTA